MAGHDIGRPWLCWYMTWRACRCFCSVTASARKPGEPITQRSELRGARGALSLACDATLTRVRSGGKRGAHSSTIFLQSRVMMLNPVLMRVSAATMQ